MRFSVKIYYKYIKIKKKSIYKNVFNIKIIKKKKKKKKFNIKKIFLIIFKKKI